MEPYQVGPDPGRTNEAVTSNVLRFTSESINFNAIPIRVPQSGGAIRRGASTMATGGRDHKPIRLTEWWP